MVPVAESSKIFQKIVNPIPYINMNDVNEKILRQKEALAAKALQVAEDSLELLQEQLDQCNTRDLVSVFNSSVKAHREIVSDIISLNELETKEEQQLAKDYESKVQSLLKKVNPKEDKQ